MTLFGNGSNPELEQAFKKENEKFREYYLWLKDAMDSQLFEELGQANAMLIVHNLMELDLQDYVSHIQLKNSSIVICLDQPHSDLHLLKNFTSHAIIDYQTYLSSSPPPFLNTHYRLKIVIVQFYTDHALSLLSAPISVESMAKESFEQLRDYISTEYPEIGKDAFTAALKSMSSHFINSFSLKDIAQAIKMHFRATTRDHCQYEVRYNEDWENKNYSMRIILAWRNIPKHYFLYRLIRTIYRHDLVVKRLSASHFKPYNPNSIMMMTLDIHGRDDKPVWEVTNLPDFIKDFITVKYFSSFDMIDSCLVQKGFITGNMGNFLRAMVNFIHQSLVHLDIHIYTLENIEEGLCRHPELTVQLCQAFKLRFDPDKNDENSYHDICKSLTQNIEKLDTGHEGNDIRRKHILSQGLNFITHILKTNFYRPNYTSLGFRLDPKYLDFIPFERPKMFPEMPFGIFFIKGMHFFGFHIRFKDLARGGLRTVCPEHIERMVIERNNVFLECYNLALTQHMKNKDIPEGGAKGIIFLKPYERLETETAILKQELIASSQDLSSVEQQLGHFREEQKQEHLYQAQRSFIESLVTLVNCESDGQLRAKDMIDYWKKPEYLYLGPDENMHDAMILWIAAYSIKHRYKPGSSFISGKPELGINHKEYGVTSLGLNVYVEATLKNLGIDPLKDPFTVKMSGGPDGDVAGNEILNLYRFYPKTAKLVALTDISGTIYDPQGLNLAILASLFHKGQSIHFYPPENLSNGGFLLDKFIKQQETPLIQQTLCRRMREGILEKEWLSGNEMHLLMRTNVHCIKADIFIPAGGRPRTLNANNIKEFLDEFGVPTAQAIIEGANLYLDSKARRILEEKGVLIIKDSSANKTGVICSSFEVLCGLTLGDKGFVENKSILIEEILKRLHRCALDEANLLFRTRSETGEYLTEISDRISKRINLFKDQILGYLEGLSLSANEKKGEGRQELHPLMHAFFNYCLPTLREHYSQELLREIPESHKKAIIASHIAAQLVYQKGLSWFPSVVDILPVLLKESGGMDFRH